MSSTKTVEAIGIYFDLKDLGSVGKVEGDYNAFLLPKSFQRRISQSAISWNKLEYIAGVRCEVVIDLCSDGEKGKFNPGTQERYNGAAFLVEFDGHISDQVAEAGITVLRKYIPRAFFEIKEEVDFRER
jgi:hypothetical protein